MKTLIPAIAAISLLAGVVADSRADASDKTPVCPNEKFDRHGFQVQLRGYVFQQYPDGKGVDVESAVSALGALSGFAVQQGLRQKLVIEQKQPEARVFAIEKTPSGERFYSGRFFDQLLLSLDPARVSVWSVIADGAQKAGAQRLPDIDLIAKNTAARMGAENYGIPEPIPDHPIKDHPADALQKHWGPVKKILVSKGSDPLMWGCEIGSVAREIMIEKKDILPPDMAAQIFMEAAIPMSKMERKIGGRK